MYFRQFWQDPRLAFDTKPGLEKIWLSGQTSYPFWTPDTFFVNSKEAYTDEEIKTSTFLRILHTGEVLLSKR